CCGGSAPMPKRTFDHIPGLLLFPDYFNPQQCSLLLRHSLGMYERLEEQVASGPKLERAGIPQPEYVRSAQHNLQSEEFFARVRLEESSDRVVRCEYFPRYGEDGHALCYFRGNPNMPDFVREHVLPGIRDTVEREQFVQPGQELTWKFTMNFYKNV